MFDAGRNSLSELLSKSTRPVSSELTLTPTIAGASSGFARIWEIRVCNSATVFGGAAGAVVCALSGANANVSIRRRDISFGNLFITFSIVPRTSDRHESKPGLDRSQSTAGSRCQAQSIARATRTRHHANLQE